MSVHWSLMVFISTVIPDPPLNVTVDSSSSRVVNISWVAGFDGNSEIQNYTVEISEDNQNFVDAMCQGSLSDNSCVVPNSYTSASIGSLSPWTTYFIRVFARNVVGTSSSSPVVNVTTDEEGILLKNHHQLHFFYIHVISSYCRILLYCVVQYSFSGPYVTF